MRWMVVGVCAAALGCNAKSLTDREATDGGRARGDSAGSGRKASPGMTGTGAGGNLGGSADGGAGTVGSPAGGRAGEAGAAGAVGTADAGAAGDATTDAGDASQPLCPPLGETTGGVDLPTAQWSEPTAVPFSCAPMPNAFFFPRPGPDVSAAYTRCASFADARAISLAVDQHGSRVALIGVDGIARIVDVASRTVVGVLAPPRASVNLAAFSPDGRTILTVARGERLVELWRADTFAPIWTTTLPGHLYDNSQYLGAAAFSPDGTAVLVSPGESLYRLDAATGAIRNTNAQLGGVVLTAAYGWSGRRIAVLSAPLSGMCTYGPHGGAVTILDPTTLAPLAKPMTWPLQGDEAPQPGQLVVAADADLLVTSAPTTGASRALQAFQLSNGGPLPSPALATFPLALSPNGTAALVGGTGSLGLVRLADGTSMASTAASAPTAVAFSADGTTVAAGSSGYDLLGIWRPTDGPLTATCTADARYGGEGAMMTSLSADGATLAVDWGQQIRIVRRADASVVSTIQHAGQSAMWLQLSPDAQHLIGEFVGSLTSPDYPVAVFRTSDGAQVADLGGRYAFQGGTWVSFAFGADQAKLDGLLNSSAGNAVVEVDLETGTVSPNRIADAGVSMVGMSGDCPLLIDSNMTLARVCGGCQRLPLASNVGSGVVSLNGGMYLGQDGNALVTGAILWNIGSRPGVVRTYPPRPEESTWQASEAPAAVSAHGSLVITKVVGHLACWYAPGFTSRVHDVATDTIVDELPPGVTSTSADLGVIAFGPVLWCAR